jgi:F420-dependent oxidoreductase-like protein
MRIGCNLPSYRLGRGDLWGLVRDRAVAVEEAGFDSLWVSDHFWQPPDFGPIESPMFEPFTLLGALAASTTRVELGVLVASATHRHASLTAKAVTTLDVISGGRAWCGIGAGWYAEEHEAYGIELPSVRERLDRLEDTVRVLRAMFDDEVATVEGRHARVRGALNNPRPVRGRLPMLIGGGGERRTLRLVAEHADACNVGSSPAELRHKLEVLRGHCDVVGRDLAEIEVTTMTTLFLADSPSATTELSDRLRSTGGDELLDACLVGEPQEVVEQAAAFADAGCQHLIVNVMGRGDEAVAAAAEALAPLHG